MLAGAFVKGAIIFYRELGASVCDGRSPILSGPPFAYRERFCPPLPTGKNSGPPFSFVKNSGPPPGGGTSPSQQEGIGN